MGYHPLRGAKAPAYFYPFEGDSGLMAGVEAGVVAGAEIYSQPNQPTKFSASLSNPATWTYVWVAVAMLYLVGIYVGAIRISGRGE